MMNESKDLSELEKLKSMAMLVKETTRGRMEVRPGVLDTVYIHPENSAYVGIELMVKPVLKPERYDVTFYARVRRMGDVLDSAGLQELIQEVQAAQAALVALEFGEFHPTQKDMEAFRSFLSEQELEFPQQAHPGLSQTL